MDSGVVVVPWEHWVCTQCLQDNPYSVWLIKLKCFSPTKQGHRYPDEKTLVSIEPSTMMLVKMRPAPSRRRVQRPTQRRYMYINVCQDYPNCQRGDACPFPHSEVEHHTWDFIRRAFRGMIHYQSHVCVYNLLHVCVRVYKFMFHR